VLGTIPVRLVGLGSYSFDIEINVYVTTSDYDEFLAVQQSLLLEFLQAVERAGTALAVPWPESIVGQALSPAEGRERPPERPPAT
jgi:MscS family membrane protein